MKNILTLVLLFAISVVTAQEVKPTYEEVGDLVKATYYYNDGAVKEQGFFKNKKLTGEWVSYNQKGEKMMVAHYNNGKKVGKWLVWNNNSLKEISYSNNKIINVRELQNHDTRLASNKE